MIKLYTVRTYNTEIEFEVDPEVFTEEIALERCAECNVPRNDNSKSWTDTAIEWISATLLDGHFDVPLIQAKTFHSLIVPLNGSKGVEITKLEIHPEEAPRIVSIIGI